MSAARLKGRARGAGGDIEGGNLPLPHTANSPPPVRAATKTTERNPDATTVTDSSPNITLNLQAPTPGKQVCLLLTAITGCLLQLGAFVIDGVVTFYFKRRDASNPLSPYAFYLTLCGTLLLVAGMVLCSYIIERSTTEIVYRVVDDTSKGFYVMWVQQGQAVNDQQFESYALFANGLRKSLITSVPVQLHEDHRRPNFNGAEEMKHGAKSETIHLTPNVLSPTQTNASELTPATHETKSTAIDPEFLVYIAVGTSMAGFFSQFIGLRGMHWSATVAQLGATLIMTVLRALVRLELAGKVRAQKLPDRFELEVLATQLAFHPQLESQAPVSGSEQIPPLWDHKFKGGHNAESRNATESPEQQGTNGKTGYWKDICVPWSVCIVDKDVSASEVTELKPRHNPLAIRLRLGKLTKWKTAARNEAVALGASLEAVVNILCTPKVGDAGIPQSISFPLDVRVNNQQQKASITLTHRKDLRWQADAEELEIFLSLWVFALGGWKSVKSKDRRRALVLGLNNGTLYRDCCWWIRENINPIVLLEKSDGCYAEGKREIEISREDLIGFTNGKSPTALPEP